MRKIITANQIHILDERFYQVPQTGATYPSVTTILQVFPKDPFFFDWLRSTGMDSKRILKEAGIHGTIVHNAVEEILKGINLTWIEDNGYENFNLRAWQEITRFVEFSKCIESIISLEEIVVSEKLRTAGTADFVGIINGKVTMVDWKTSNAMYPTYKMQLAVYAEMYEEMTGTKIEEYGVLWLNAKTRTVKDWTQGVKWQYKSYTEFHDESMELWHHTRALFDKQNPNYRPRNLEFSNTLSVNIPAFSVTEQPEKVNRRTNHIVNIKTGEEYSSIKEVSDELHFPYRRLCDMLKGRRENVTDLKLCDG